MTEPGPRRGFTLLELLIVIAIFGVAVLIVWPRLPSVARAERGEALRKLAGSAEVLFEYSAFKKKALPSYMISRNRNTGPA